MKIAVVAQMPLHGFFGGRYATLMMTKALLRAGAEIEILTDAMPDMWSHLENIETPTEPTFRTEAFNLASKSMQNDSNFDLVICVPSGRWHPVFLRALRLARKSNSPLILLNFETPNWYNQTSSSRRHRAHWWPWFWTGFASNVILSISHEGSHFAKRYYKFLPKQAFAVASPSINDRLARQVLGERLDRKPYHIFVASKLSGGEHKGFHSLKRILADLETQLHVVVMVNDPMSPHVAELRECLERKGSTLEVRHSIGDLEKFRLMAQSVVTVFPSTFEGLGYPPIESLSVGTPCVTYDLPVFKETLGDNLLAAPLGDETRLAALVCQALREDLTDKLPLRPAHYLDRFSVGSYERELMATIFPLVTSRKHVSLGRSLIAMFALEVVGFGVQLAKRISRS